PSMGPPPSSVDQVCTGSAHFCAATVVAASSGASVATATPVAMAIRASADAAAKVLRMVVPHSYGSALSIRDRKATEAVMHGQRRAPGLGRMATRALDRSWQPRWARRRQVVVPLGEPVAWLTVAVEQGA